LEGQVEAALDAVQAGLVSSNAVHGKEEVAGLNLEKDILVPWETEDTTVLEFVLGVGMIDHHPVKGRVVRREENLAAADLHTYLRDEGGRGLVARVLEEPIQLNIFSGEQVEPLVGQALEVELVTIEAREMRITPDQRADGVEGIAARTAIDSNVDKPIHTSSARLAGPGVVAGVLIIAKVLNGPIKALNEARGISSNGDRSSTGIANREAERYQEREHHEENSSLHHLVGVVVRSVRNGGLLLLLF